MLFLEDFVPIAVAEGQEVHEPTVLHQWLQDVVDMEK
jgi:hypothetical protein